MRWRDASSYSRGERGVIAPTAWELDCGPVKITVHHYIGCGANWFVSSEVVGLRTHDLKTDDVEAAKASAVALVKQRLKAMCAAVERCAGVG